MRPSAILCGCLLVHLSCWNLMTILWWLLHPTLWFIDFIGCFWQSKWLSSSSAAWINEFCAWRHWFPVHVRDLKDWQLCSLHHRCSMRWWSASCSAPWSWFLMGLIWRLFWSCDELHEYHGGRDCGETDRMGRETIIEMENLSWKYHWTLVLVMPSSNMESFDWTLSWFCESSCSASSLNCSFNFY